MVADDRTNEIVFYFAGTGATTTFVAPPLFGFARSCSGGAVPKPSVSVLDPGGPQPTSKNVLRVPNPGW